MIHPALAIEMSKSGVASLFEAIMEESDGHATDALLVLAISFAHTSALLHKATTNEQVKKDVRDKTKAGVATILMMLKANGVDIGVEAPDISDIGEVKSFTMYHDGKETHSVN